MGKRSLLRFAHNTSEFYTMTESNDIHGETNKRTETNSRFGARPKRIVPCGGLGFFVDHVRIPFACEGSTATNHPRKSSLSRSASVPSFRNANTFGIFRISAGGFPVTNCVRRAAARCPESFEWGKRHRSKTNRMVFTWREAAS